MGRSGEDEDEDEDEDEEKTEHQSTGLKNKTSMSLLDGG